MANDPANAASRVSTSNRSLPSNATDTPSASTIAPRPNGSRGTGTPEIAEATAVYGDLNLDLSKIENIETWTIHDEPYLGLGAAVQRFTDLCFTEASGLYDHLSDYSHPSLLATTRQTTSGEGDGVTSRTWTVDVTTIEHQTRLTCLILYKAAHLIADYYDTDAAQLERWADFAPPAWFNTATE